MTPAPNGEGRTVAVRTAPAAEGSRRHDRAWHVLVLAVSVLAWGAVAWLGLTRDVEPVSATDLLWGIGFLPLQVVGVIVLRARPRDVVGRALVYAPLLIVLSMVLFAYGQATLTFEADRLTVAADPSPGTYVSFYVAEMALGVGNGGLLLAFFRFPDGQSLGGLWRVGERLLAAAVVLSTVGVAFAPTVEGTSEAVQVPNPFVAGGAETLATAYDVGGLLFFITAGLAMGSVVARYRGGSPTTRLQLRWVLYPILVGVMLLGLVELADAGLETDLGRTNGPASVVISLVFTAGIPAGIVIAITRSRLYDIDRLLSRTVSWALVTASLIGIYALGVLGIGALLPGERSDLLVAGSTLAVATLFRPLRSRVQGLVDRRFNRARRDANRIAEAFSSRLRDEIDLSALRADLLNTARASVEPTAASLWLAP